ncbi:hypothetical protein [Desulfosporosinus sp. FKA]|uniref:hypothetical protein n=1 Tax=Desulfosporosinus sp. FKA TaxID=1969834 RepID=UPI000B49B4CC|nr:hypothetical protein [Desulfosporosinus sp. FKA]
MADEIIRAAFKVAERWLYNLTKWKAEIEVMLENQNDHSSKITAGYSPGIGGSGTTSDSTSLRAAIILIEEDKLPVLQSKVRMMDAAIDSLGDDQRQLVKLKYVKCWTNQSCWEHMRLSESDFYRERRKAVGRIAEVMLNADQFLVEVDRHLGKNEIDRNLTGI